MPQHHSDVATHRRPAICFSSAHLERGSLAMKKPSAGLKLQSALAASLAMALLALSAGTSAFAQGSTDRSREQIHADIWRATSRLGYAPTVASAEAARPNPKAWALQQIDAAYAASQRPSALPAELADVAKPLAKSHAATRLSAKPGGLRPTAPPLGTLPLTLPAWSALQLARWTRRPSTSAATWRKPLRPGASPRAATRRWSSPCWPE